MSNRLQCDEASEVYAISMSSPDEISPREDAFPTLPVNRFERLPVWIAPAAADAVRRVAEEIAALIRLHQAQGRPTVLGLATGSTPIGIYRELIRLHREGLSFRDVITFNLDEYYGLPPEAPESYHRFMREQFFAHVDVRPENIHLPDGMVSRAEVAGACRDYERKIRDAGGLDLQILGIGRTGHIGFNEPGSTPRSRTRVITLDHLTRRDNAQYFSDPDHMPIQAVTMGIGTILDARRVILLAFGEHKAEIVRRAFEGEPHADVPASFLQHHDNALVILDEAAASRLTRIQCPWLTGPLADLGLEWDATMTRRAVTWLTRAANKPVLKLTDLDYNEHGLQELLGEFGSAYAINLEVFRSVQKTITGWPGGRPEERGVRRILIFSPHPDDDVISMGGTLIRLAEQGHEVHVAYQVSGSNAVANGTVRKYLRFAREAAPGRADESSENDLRACKALIRRLETIEAALVCKVPEDRLHFLNLPFYESADRSVTPRDVEITRAILEDVRPHQIYAAGDLADPHGTHRICLQVVREALRQCEGSPWAKECVTWLYRGAWKEWELHEVEMAVPISPGEVLHKRRAIFQHETQKDQAMFLGEDGREFWQRAEERTQASAAAYRAFGMVDYEAIETFARLRPEA